MILFLFIFLPLPFVIVVVVEGAIFRNAAAAALFLSSHFKEIIKRHKFIFSLTSFVSFRVK